MNVQRPPGDFITLDEAINKPPSASNNVIGVVVDYLPPAKSRGSDYTTTFVLHDPSWQRGDRGMKFRCFHKKAEGLPDIRNNGDIVILWKVNTRERQGLIGVSSSSTSWVVLQGPSVVGSKCANGSDIQSSRYQRAHGPSIELLQYAKHIIGHTDPSSFRTPSIATALQVEGITKENEGKPPAKSGKRRLLQDLNLSKTPSGKFADGKPAFADLFGEVRRMHKGDYVKVELYLTDYTSNPKLYNYDPDPQSRDGDNYGYVGGSKSWPGPWGRMAIHVACWDAHATFARTDVDEGMYVLIKNCQIKFDPNGSTLEASCRGDRDDASRINIVVCHPNEAGKDEAFKQLLKRKMEYEKMATGKGLRISKDVKNSNGKRDAENSARKDDTKPSKKLSNTQRRKLNATAKKQAAEAKATVVTTVPAELLTNQSVRCENIEVPFSIIDNILDTACLKRTTPAGNTYLLPFQNCRYKAKVRVVDFFPDDITEFAIPRPLSLYDALGDSEEEDDRKALLAQAESSPDSVEWVWHFMLIVEDANFKPLNSDTPRKQMPLLVAGSDAEYLLREPTACDLRKNPQVLATLKEQLFHLWGDLQERKEEGTVVDMARGTKPSSKPFDCHIMEYGRPKPNEDSDETMGLEYQRMFKLCGTSI